jgi:hypothetical protein
VTNCLGWVILIRFVYYADPPNHCSIMNEYEKESLESTIKQIRWLSAQHYNIVLIVDSFAWIVTFPAKYYAV